MRKKRDPAQRKIENAEYRKKHLVELQKYAKEYANAHKLEAQAWRDDNRERTKEWRKRNAGNRKQNKNSLAAQLSNHALTKDEFHAMLIKQSGLCDICLKPLLKPYIDHCHTTKRIRALLCNGCNVGLGAFCENILTMKAAIEYLQKFATAPNEF